ncbi:MAG: 1-acyl-sn-glycerol-3-phosphate acyltransferase [Pseudobdellovibrionaceae bacterium]|nr:1-acyl-sn-glycerol-3-phosphate acyltransferase [Pseudobdellovibrionaceae bacterium]
MNNSTETMSKPLTAGFPGQDYLRAVVFWITFVFATIMCYLILLAIVIWKKLFDPKRLTHGAHWLATFWARWIMHAAPGWRWSYSGFENLPKEGEPPVVLVANHQSSADIGSIYLTQAQFRWLSKDTVFRLPCIGHAMKWAGYVPIKRGDGASSRSAMVQSANWIRRGVSMFYFPEGTRSEDGRLREFKMGAFRLAIEEGVAVCPVVLCGTKHMMRKNSGIPKAAHLILDVMPKVWPLPEETPELFAVRVRSMIETRLRYLESIR